MEQLKNLMPSEMLVQSYKSKPLTPEERAKQRCEIMNNDKGNLHEFDGYDCPLCNNRGGHFEAREQGGYWYEVMTPCKCDKIRRAIRRLKKSGLKDVVKKYTFDNYEANETWRQKIKSTAIQYCKEGNGSWFFIGGQSGAGKTHICSAVAIHLLKQGHSTKYMMWQDEAVSLKSAANDSELYNQLIEPIKKAEVLYIDDLFKTGKDKGGDYLPPTTADIKVAFEIINYRYNNKKLYTIISSERTLAQLLNIDEAIGGRIAEMAVQQGFGFSINPDPNKNYRLKGICEL